MWYRCSEVQRGEEDVIEIRYLKKINKWFLFYKGENLGVVNVEDEAVTDRKPKENEIKWRIAPEETTYGDLNGGGTTRYLIKSHLHLREYLEKKQVAKISFACNYDVHQNMVNQFGDVNKVELEDGSNLVEKFYLYDFDL